MIYWTNLAMSTDFVVNDIFIYYCIYYPIDEPVIILFHYQLCILSISPEVE